MDHFEVFARAPIDSGDRDGQVEGFKDLVRDLGLVDYWRTTGYWGDYARPVGENDFELW